MEIVDHTDAHRPHVSEALFEVIYTSELVAVNYWAWRDSSILQKKFRCRLVLFFLIRNQLIYP